MFLARQKDLNALVEWRATLKTLLPCILILVASTEVVLAQSDEARAPVDLNTCILCHGTPEFWTEDKARLYVPQSDLEGDVHYQKGLKCHECHGGNPRSLDPAVAHATGEEEMGTGDRPFQPFGDMTKTCGACHTSQYEGLLHGRHAGAANGDAKKPVACNECHGDKPHGILPVADPLSPVNSRNQVKKCGACHETELDEYTVSGHGYGLFRSGLRSAVCGDCHDPHGVFPVTDERSKLHVTQVADTCATCHRFILDRLNASVHGRGNGLGGLVESPASEGDTRRRPTCTDCHVGHDLPDPRAEAFRLDMPDRCGGCHADLTRGYRMSLHGALTELGYGPGAQCSDCHGGHDILPLSDPNSMMSEQNRLQTCATCHPNISPNLISFDPHADHNDQARSPILYWAFRGVATFIIVVFGFFGLHSIFWFVRVLIDSVQHGRPKLLGPNDTGFLRFRPFHRVAHTVMVVSFLGLALTGMPLKFSDYEWAKWLAYILGGFSSTALWHRIFSITTFGCFLAYVGLLSRVYYLKRKQGQTFLKTVFGPDSPVPNLRDARDFFAMARWFFGLGPKPTFERWAYWEKFDFFGATSDIILIGTTGLILWFPNWFCQFLPGEAVNVAKVVHSTLSLLATGFVFAIHFFGTHFRPDKFPMDMSILTGVVTEEEMEHERPDLLERMRAEGQLEEMQVTAPGRLKLCAVRFAGLVALAIGLATLAGIVWSLLV